MKQPVYILGINDSHGSTAALLRDGEIVACASEERFTRKKGQTGYPQKSISYCLESARIEAEQVSQIVFGFKNLSFSIHGEYRGESSIYGLIHTFLSNFLRSTFMMFVGKLWILYFAYSAFYNTIYFWVNAFFLEQQRKKTIDAMFSKSAKILILDHHTAHAMAAFYAGPMAQEKKKKVLVITNDGMGDRVCSRIFIVQNDQWEEIASTPNEYSLGMLYLYVTEYLGMKSNEHEYKVMGLAPYAHRTSAEEIASLFRHIMFVDGLSVKSTIPAIAYLGYIQKYLAKKRFDAIAGGIQLFTEEILMTLVRNAIQKTNIHNVVLGGGVFMNIKANMEISKISEIERLFVMPSSSDESTAIGAAYWGYKMYCEENGFPFKTEPLSSLYLGPSFSRSEIKEALDTFMKKNPRIKITRLIHPARHIAKLLACGKIVARFAGRMEFGARALGNRSILANPADRSVIRVINDQIKGRDFWMPFAPVILKECADDYLIRHNHRDSPYMMIGYETTLKARKDLIAGIHPYDYTARPQILSRQHNPEYYDIIDEFRKITNVGALLNTSLNIHGEPIVCSPADALSTFERSGLEYLLLEDYLISKLK